jgi:hypothetical protein
MLALGLLLLAQALHATNEPSNGKAGDDPLLDPASSPCSAVLVSSPQVPEPRLRWFSASQILDLRFRTTLARPLKGQHVLELRVYTPKGHLYQVLSVPFAAPVPTKPAPKRMPREPIVEGNGNAATNRAAEVEIDEPDPTPSLDATLPVGGTSIVTSSLYGRWTVTPHLDGSLDACGPARQFRIEQ